LNFVGDAGHSGSRRAASAASHQADEYDDGKEQSRQEKVRWKIQDCVRHSDCLRKGMSESAQHVTKL